MDFWEFIDKLLSRLHGHRNYEDALELHMEALKELEFSQIQLKTDVYSTMYNLLLKLRANGLISQEEYEALVQLKEE